MRISIPAIRISTTHFSHDRRAPHDAHKRGAGHDRAATESLKTGKPKPHLLLQLKIRSWNPGIFSEQEGTEETEGLRASLCLLLMIPS